MGRKNNIAQFNKDLKFRFFGDIDEIIDEKGSQYIAIRKTAWYSGDKEPTEEKAHLEIRKWQVQEGSENDDSPRKGVTFLTEEGPHNLVEALTRHGYGNTKQVLKNLKTRDDFEESVKHMYDDDDDTDNEDFFDARDSLLEA